MQYGNFAVDYEYRPYNPERMRKERVARAQASLKKHGLGAVILFDFDYHRYLGYFSFHQYCRRRLGHFVLLIEGEGFPYVPHDHYHGTWDQARMPWFEGKMVIEASKAFSLQQGLPDHPNYVPGEMDKIVAEVKGLLKKHGKADMPVGIDVSNYHLIKAFERAGLKICDGLTAMIDAIHRAFARGGAQLLVNQRCAVKSGARGDVVIDIKHDPRITRLETFPGSAEDRALYRRFSAGNTLLRNRGDGTFEDGTDRAGVRGAFWAWGNHPFDYDSDGDLDLFVCGGFYTGASAADT